MKLFDVWYLKFLRSLAFTIRCFSSNIFTTIFLTKDKKFLVIPVFVLTDFETWLWTFWLFSQMSFFKVFFIKISSVKCSFLFFFCLPRSCRADPGSLQQDVSCCGKRKAVLAEGLIKWFSCWSPGFKPAAALPLINILRQRRLRRDDRQTSCKHGRGI